MAAAPGPVSMRAMMTYVLGLVVLGIGVAFFLASLLFYAEGATTEGTLLGPISVIVLIVGAVLSVGAIAKGS